MTIVNLTSVSEANVTSLAADLAARPTNTQTAAGANTATYGRTSTIAAPVLRDVVSLLDFATSTNGNGTTDDTTIVQNAINAINTLGGGTLVIPPTTTAGALANWHVGNVRVCDHLKISAYGANFTANLSTTYQNNAMFYVPINLQAVGTWNHVDVQLLGGNFNGTGNEASKQWVTAWYRIQDVVIRDTKVTNWGSNNGGGTHYVSDAQRVRIQNNTLVGCSGGTGSAFNQIQVDTSTTYGSTSTPFTDIIVTGNICTAGACAALCINIGSPDNYTNILPTRAVISNNDVESTTWSAIALEIGGTTVMPQGTIQEVIISNNHCRYSGPNSGICYGIFVQNDSSPLINSGLIFQDIIISHNQIDSNRHGLICQATRGIIDGNIINAAWNGIVYTAPGTSTVSHVHIKGGIVHMADGGGGNAVSVTNVTDGTVETDIYFDTGATGTGTGITLTGCSRVGINSKISQSPKQGIVIDSCGNVRINPGTRVYNPGSNGGSPGIFVKGTLTGDVLIEGAHVFDDRGSPLMTYGINNTSTGGNVYSMRNKYLGWTTAAWNGTLLLQLHDIVDSTGVVWTAQKRESWATAAPTTGTWAVGDKVWNTAPTSGGTAAWVCITAGTPGTWQSVTLGSGGSTSFSPTVVTSTNASVAVPSGANNAVITAVGGGGAGGGGGAAALTSGTATQVGGGGGGSGQVVRQTPSVSGLSTLSVTIGAGGTGGTGGTASTDTSGHAGSAGVANANQDTVITGTGISITASGGSPGNGGGANSTTSVNAGAYGARPNGGLVSNNWIPGCGGVAGSATGTGGGSAIDASGRGGGGGCPASATLGGNAGSNLSGSGHTATTAGATASGASANTGQGGDGGGGGAPGGAGGNGGNGGSGYVVIQWLP